MECHYTKHGQTRKNFLRTRKIWIITFGKRLGTLNTDNYFWKIFANIYSRFSRSFTARGYLLGNPPGYKANKLYIRILTYEPVDIRSNPQLYVVCKHFLGFAHACTTRILAVTYFIEFYSFLLD